MIEKSAIRQRARRIEPAQEEIVSGKDALNERISKLITFLIELKRGMNGGPAPGIGVPKYKLTQPMPDQVVSSGDRASQELDAIIQELKGIDTKQHQYAKNKFEQLNQRVQQFQNLQEQAQERQAVASIEHELKKLASSKLSRLWAHIAGPFTFSEKGVQERLALLRTLARMNSNLKDLEDKVLSGSSSSLDAVEEAKALYLDARINFFQEYRENLNRMLSTTEREAKKLELEADNLLDYAKATLSGDKNQPEGKGTIDLSGKKDKTPTNKGLQGKPEASTTRSTPLSGTDQGVVDALEGIVNTLSGMQNRIDTLQSTQHPDVVSDTEGEGTETADPPPETTSEAPEAGEEASTQPEEDSVPQGE